MTDLGELRMRYDGPTLEREDLAADPIQQFQEWFELHRAEGRRDVESTAMALATADRNGYPTVRMVLLKGITDGGFTFYTNRRSRKGRDLRENPHAALLFFWPERQRQVRVTGTVTPIAPGESDTYFASRPRGSQIAAVASHQSAVVSDRATLERRTEDVAAQYQGRDVPRPDDWRGYRLAPVTFEFWQGRPDRLHDRFRYRRSAGPHVDGPSSGSTPADAKWTIERLMP